jgi:hypothetical protein
MIEAFMDTLSKDMHVIEDNIAMHTATLEELLYQRRISFYDQLEVWIVYLKERNPKKEKITTRNCYYLSSILCFSQPTPILYLLCTLVTKRKKIE